MNWTNVKSLAIPVGGVSRDVRRVSIGGSVVWEKNTTPTARDYVQSGLVAMWDGIENAGWGTHDANATVWKDLIGSANQSVSGGSGWLGNGYSWAEDTSTYQMCNCGNVFNSNAWTLDVVVSRPTSYGANFPGINGQGAASNIIYMRCFDANARVGFSAYGNRFAMVTANANMKQMSLVCDGTNITAYWDGINVGYTDYDPSVTLNGLLYWRRGTLHACRAYSLALTAAEIAANYAIDKARFGLP